MEFVCIVALASEESQTAREFVDYLSGEGVKLCVMAHDNSELRLLKNLLHGGRQEAECIELDKSSCE